MLKLCPPSNIYVIFSITQILIDTFKGGYSIVSWVIVFIPFILMTVIVSMLLYIFGLDAATGTLNTKCDPTTEGVTVDASGNIIIYDPEYNSTLHPVYYQSPNIIVPNPHSNDNTNITTTYIQPVPYGSTSPAYQS